MKKIAFLSNGCQGGLCKPREIIAADPNYREVRDPKQADVIMVNFCAISAENLDAFDRFRSEVIQYKRSNPELKVIAGGCIEGLSEQRDLSFADAIFHHQEEATTLAAFLGKDAQSALSPAIMNGAALINISQGCNRRCSFCKVHFLKYMRLTSRPMDEILGLAKQALAQGISTIVLSAENSTEYGIDLGTNLQTLLEHLVALDGLRILDVYGLCLDEVTPALIQTLKHPKIRALQLEVQSLNDQIRKNMNLHKTANEALAVLDALSGKFLISNLMTGFPGHSVSEFNREMRAVHAHHLYYLSLDPYDDTPGAPSHKMYQPLDKTTSAYYQEAFLRAVAKERKLLLELLMRLPFIEASVVSADYAKVHLYASHYTLEICAEQLQRRCRPGDIVQVKITGLHENMPDFIKRSLFGSSSGQLPQYMQYFDAFSKEQFMQVDGKIINSIS